MKKLCKTCCWWARHPNHEILNYPTGEEVKLIIKKQTHGQCRLSPPALGEAAWPVTDEDDFCGKWKKK